MLSELVFSALESRVIIFLLGILVGYILKQCPGTRRVRLSDIEINIPE